MTWTSKVAPDRLLNTAPWPLLINPPLQVVVPELLIVRPLKFLVPLVLMFGDEELEDAARQANAHDFIMSFPDGYDTLVGERGMQLSGGQRQRISIARALLKNSPVLVLDEATSHLDAVNEQQVRQALERLMEGRTTVVIAHRLSTIRDADQIVVLDTGHLVEQGNHHELLERHGLYASLVSTQLLGALSGPGQDGDGHNGPHTSAEPWPGLTEDRHHHHH